MVVCFFFVEQIRLGELHFPSFFGWVKAQHHLFAGAKNHENPRDFVIFVQGT